MAVTATNLIQGPANLWTGPFGTTEPATVATAPGAGWVDAGATQDGVKLTVKQDYASLEVDQLIDIPERRITNREITVETNLAEATLTNLVVALNGGTAATGTGVLTYTPVAGAVTGAAPTYTALLFDAVAPGGFKRRVIVRKCLSTDAVEHENKKDDQTLFGVTFTSHWVSTSILPFSVVDATA